MTLIELVADNVNGDKKTWGMVDPRHTIETLAEECGVTPEYLREFLAFCNKYKIFLKKHDCLFWPEIANRLDNWTAYKTENNYKATTKSLGSHFAKKEKEKEKEKNDVNFNLDKIAELKNKAHELIGTIN
jgi:hypothetical protein